MIALHNLYHVRLVMIGYSDSAKDAGRLAASWAQYETQEALVSPNKKLTRPLNGVGCNPFFSMFYMFPCVVTF